jgi:hypothetical protein
VDYRNIPEIDGRSVGPRACGPIRGGGANPGSQRAFVGGLALYLYVATALGLPLAFPAHALLWVLLDLLLAVALGFVLSRVARTGGMTTATPPVTPWESASQGRFR